jgi:hypothetical protein
MRTARAFGFVLALISLARAARAEPAVEELMSCAAEFQARAVYAEKLGHSDSGHVAFFSGRSDSFLRLAEARAPKTMIGCSGDSGPRISLVLCLEPADLAEERAALVEERLIALAEENRGSQRLQVCMVDEACAECLRLFNRMVRARFPGAWKTAPP